LARFGVPLLILAVTRLILPVYRVIAFVLVVGRAGYYRSKPRFLVRLRTAALWHYMITGIT
jgi:hypothetical protein